MVRLNGAGPCTASGNESGATAYLRKWVVLGALIGVISGLGAALFFVALDLATRFLLGALAGFVPASPLGEGAQPITDAARPWAIPLVVGLGGLISGIIVFRLAPEAEGHGTDAAIGAYPPRGPPDPRADSARQARRVGDHDRIGRIGRSRGPDRPDRCRLRLVPRSPARPRRSGRTDRRCLWHGSRASGRSSGPPWAARSWRSRFPIARTSSPRRWSRRSWPRSSRSRSSAPSSASTPIFGRVAGAGLHGLRDSSPTTR